MKLKLSRDRMERLRAFLEDFADAEPLSEREYVVDLYDIARPLSLDLVFIGSDVAVDGAAELLYDDEMDGWYMGRRVDDAALVTASLEEAGAWAI